MRRIAMCWLLFGLVAGCGGKTERSPEDGPPAPSDGTEPGDPGWPSGKLGKCVPGTPAGSAESCAWFADGDCYPNKAAACNCICPTDHDSTCMSDFPEPGVPAKVSCF